MQTVLPALWFADGRASVMVSGGTHNPAAPPADFLMEVWLPLIQQMGVRMDFDLQRHGFYPAGGGRLCIRVTPGARLAPLHPLARGKLLGVEAVAIVAGISGRVAERELAVLADRLSDLGPEFVGMETTPRGLPANEGPGNAVHVALRYENVTELLTGFGEKSVSAEVVAAQLGDKVRAFHLIDAAVGEHLADQLLLPMTLAGGGSFTTPTQPAHLMTRCAVIGQFLPVRFDCVECGAFYTVTIVA